MIDAYAKMVGLMGPAGAGQLTKMVNQICIAGLVQGLAEGIHFAKQAGLDVEKVIGVISKGAAQSWQMENRWKTMNEGKFDFGFAVDWMRKDLGICLDEARDNGAQLPVTALVDQFYAEVQAMGGRRWDTSSLIARLEREVTAPTADRGRCRSTTSSPSCGARLGGGPRRHGALRHQHRNARSASRWRRRGRWRAEYRRQHDCRRRSGRPASTRRASSPR